MDVSWRKYINKTKKRPARAVLVEALPYVLKKDSALDLGAGALMDSKYLLQNGFKYVTAVDIDPASKELAEGIKSKRFTFFSGAFSEFSFPIQAYDLISAQRSLPYVSPEVFVDILGKIKRSLKSGGIFAAHVFGDRDENILEGVSMTRLSKNKILECLSDLEIIKLAETDEDKESALGKMKHFHEIEIIARKK